MEMQKRIEHEIDLWELFWGILLGWRQMICVGIIVAVLLCGGKYALSLRDYQMTQNVDMSLTESALGIEEAEQLSNARSMVARIKEYQEYLDTSPLMQLDPYEKHMIELQYYVESDYTYNYTKENQNDYTGSLMALYYNYIIGGEMSQNIIQETNLPVSQSEFSELWIVSQVANSISIKIAYPEKNKLEDIAEFVKIQLAGKETEFQKIGSHRLRLLEESQNVVVDIGLAERKNTVYNNITTINAQLSALKADMTDQQLSLLREGENESEKEAEKVIIPKPVPSKKYFLLGAFLGIFLVCAWVACKMLFTARLQNPEEIRALYNTRLLGEVTVKSKKKRFLSVIDDKLLAIKNRRKKKLSVEQQVKVIAANISLSCKQQGIENIYMTGSEYENADTATLDMLKQELTSQNIQVKEGGNIFYDAESLKQGTEIGNMIFVEQTGESIYDEISNELNLAREQKNQILGVVVLVY